MNRPLLLVGLVGALLAANQKAHAQGLFGLLQDAATTPATAVRDLAGSTTQTTTKVGTEVIYLAGDGTETVYKHHPGARVGRKAGIMPQGKLGLLPSHADSPTSPETVPSEMDGNPDMADPKDDASREQPKGPVHAKRTAEKPAQAIPARRPVAKRRRSRGFVSRLFRFGRR